MVVFNQKQYPEELGTGQGISIADYGCALCALASLLSAFGISISPLDLNQLLIKNDVYANNGLGQYDLITWDKISTIYPQVSLSFVNFYPTNPADLSLIDQQLAKGYPVIVGVDLNHNPKTQLPTHFVTIYQKNTDGTYQCVDSWYNDDTVFDKRYAVNGMSVAQCILETISFSGQTDPLVCDPKSIRDMLVAKASHYDEFVQSGYTSVQDIQNKLNNLAGINEQLSQKIGELQKQYEQAEADNQKSSAQAAEFLKSMEAIKTDDSNLAARNVSLSQMNNQLLAGEGKIAKQLGVSESTDAILSAIIKLQKPVVSVQQQKPTKPQGQSFSQWLQGLFKSKKGSDAKNATTK